ncbi:hypothetical protein CO614_00605 [Lysobacteraceae bacterium NML120232]|nr:hypothetical protein CO614_00605 [Xanthomonadaceae bacterium NML120232]
MRTHEPTIDQYLQQINQHLIGSRAVRSHTLNEARDFLLDVAASARPEDKAAALAEAMQEYGSPGHIGKEQRKERHQICIKIALLSGPIFAVLMLLTMLLQAGVAQMLSAWQTWLLVFFTNMLLFGLGMGASFAYLIAFPATPSQAGHTPAADNRFEMICRPVSRKISWMMLAVFVPFEILLLLALFGIDLIPGLEFSRLRLPAVLLLAFINFKNITASLNALWFKAYVEHDILHVQRLGRSWQLRRQDILAVTRPSLLRQFFSIQFGQQQQITWQTATGQKQQLTLSISADVINGDRLVAWLESAAHENRH